MSSKVVLVQWFKVCSSNTVVISNIVVNRLFTIFFMNVHSFFMTSSPEQAMYNSMYMYMRSDEQIKL